MIKTIEGLKVDRESPVYDYSAIESLDEFKELLSDIKVPIVIWAVKKRSTGGDLSIVYGREQLQLIAKKIIPTHKLKMVYIGIDENEIEHLAAAVQTIFGSHDLPAE
jgi:hypothetical protein